MDTKIINEAILQEEFKQQNLAVLRGCLFAKQLRLAASEGLLAGLLHTSGIDLQTLELRSESKS